MVEQPTVPPAQAARRVKPQTSFNWNIYGSATLAGLAVLIPFPFIDAILEAFFRRRMVIDIATFNRRSVSGSDAAMLSRANPNWLMGCLLLPFRAIFYLFKDIFRTILYALTIADATERLGDYWYRAFLINYAMQRGDLDQPQGARLAAGAMQETLSSVTTSPLKSLAQELVNRARGTFTRLRAFIPFVRQRDRMPAPAAEKEIETAWRDLEGYLVTVAARYDQAFDRQLALAEQRAADARVRQGA